MLHGESNYSIRYMKERRESTKEGDTSGTRVTGGGEKGHPALTRDDKKRI